MSYALSGTAPLAAVDKILLKQGTADEVQQLQHYNCSVQTGWTLNVISDCRVGDCVCCDLLATATAALPVAYVTVLIARTFLILTLTLVQT